MRLKAILLLLMTASVTTLFASEDARLLRFPTVSGNNLVFTYAGDIYSVDKSGGVARKLTSDIGYEMMPRFSPDGKTIAFTGQYDGNTEVFTIPANGGEPKRITYTATLGRDDMGDRMGPNNMVMDWTPDGKYITYRSRRHTYNAFTGQLFNAPVDGGLSVEVPLKNGGFATWSPDGKQLAYNYIFREFRTWKRYQGGMADDLRIFDTKTKKSIRITDNKAQDIVPMWSKDGSTIYYISDVDNVMNLYSYGVENKDTKQLTFNKDYDIKYPTIGADCIVYEYAGYIYSFDIKTSKANKVDIQINNDRLYARPKWMDLSKSTGGYNLRPDGKTVALTARGDIFFVPVKEGVTLNYTNSSNANDKFGVWSPSGDKYAYVSDKTGEFQIHILDYKTKKERQLTKGVKTFIFNIEFSPNGKNIMWADKSNSLFITNVESGATKEVEKSTRGALADFDWAGDSRWITYTRPELTMSNIVLYDTQTDKKIVVTDGWYSSNNPRFSRDGKYLFFSSDRTFNPTYSRTEWNHAYTNMTKIYFIPLAANTPSPFILSEEPVKKEESKKDKKNKKEIDNVVASLVIDEEGIQDRVIDLPILAGSYYINAIVDNKVYYSRGSGSYVYDLTKKEEKEVGARLMISSDYKKALAISGGNMEVISLPTAKVTVKKKIDFSNVNKQVNFAQEWKQIYDESWRQMRNYFYDKDMHGVDWDAVYEKYAVLVPHVAHRSDLAYIIGEMIGELNVGHAYSQNGEAPKPQRIQMGLLGARFKQDKSGYFKVSKILKGVSWSSSIRSPLAEVGIDVEVGNYILAIDGISTKTTDDIYTLLVNKANRYVELTVSETPNAKNGKVITVKPIADESSLYYYNWVQDNIDKVSKATGGKVGYIHIPDMGVAGLNEFMKHYYPQLRKEALIIDDRGNGGGNVSPMIIERLLRTPAFYTMHTNQTEGSVSPTGTFVGPKVLLINEYSASDGDLFPYRFKFNKMGTIIGRRTWGGVVGYSGSVPVVDGGSIVTPSYAPYSVDGSEFIIEGRGVEPDIDVENDAYQQFIGNDQQLTKAIEVALKKLTEKPTKHTAIPAFPNKDGVGSGGK